MLFRFIGAVLVLCQNYWILKSSVTEDEFSKEQYREKCTLYGHNQTINNAKY